MFWQLVAGSAIVKISRQSAVAPPAAAVGPESILLPAARAMHYFADEVEQSLENRRYAERVLLSKEESQSPVPEKTTEQKELDARREA